MAKADLFIGCVIILVGNLMTQTSPTITRVYSHFEGSAPPVPAMYQCIEKLEGKPYSEAEVGRCLNSILESKYFLKGSVRILSRDTSAIRLEFILEAPPLTLTDLNIKGVEDRDAGQLRKWLGKDVQTLTAGRTYTKPSDELTQQRIEQFFGALGRRVAISSNLELNYADRTARLSYRIFEGPRGPVQYDVAPPEEACKDQVGELNLTDVDDYVPLVLVERLTRLHAFSCFDEKLVLEDTRRLEETNLFQSVEYSVAGDPSFRRVTLSIRGKPLKIDRISMQGYGTFSDLGPAKDSQLPIGIGDVYKRSEIVKAAEKLIKSAGRPQEKVDVFVDVEPISPNSVAVTFQILTYDSDKLYIDGKRIDGAGVAVSAHSPQNAAIRPATSSTTWKIFSAARA